MKLVAFIVAVAIFAVGGYAAGRAAAPSEREAELERMSAHHAVEFRAERASREQRQVLVSETGPRQAAVLADGKAQPTASELRDENSRAVSGSRTKRRLRPLKRRTGCRH